VSSTGAADAGEVGVLDVGHHQSNGCGAIGSQAAGYAIGPIPQQLHRLQYALLYLFPDMVFACQDSGNSRGGEPAVISDIANTCHGTPLEHQINASSGNQLDKVQSITVHTGKILQDFSQQTTFF
jgi:hypothetical protein